MNKSLPSGLRLLAEMGIDLKQLRYEALPKRVHYRAVVNWLTAYQGNTQDNSLEKIRGYLEAFYHLSKLEEWEKSSYILFSKVDILQGHTLVHELHSWGYHREKITVLSTLLNKLSKEVDALCLRNLAGSYFLLGNLQQCIACNEKSLELAKGTKDRENEKATLRVMISLCFSLKQYEKVRAYSNRWLKLHDKQSPAQAQGEILAVLAAAYAFLGKEELSQNAMDRSQRCLQSMSATEKINVLNAQGGVFLSVEQYDKALRCYQDAWQVVQTNNLPTGTGILQNMGQTLMALKRFVEAEDAFLHSLDIARTNGIRVGEATGLYKLAEFYTVNGQKEMAVQYCSRALSLSTELNIPLIQQCQNLKSQLLNIKPA